LKIYKTLFLIFLGLALGSCIGLSADITMRRDGSGRISLEYRISQMAEDIGRLDGNEQWPVIPTGRRDFERTIARIPDMRLVSFSSREETAPDGKNKNIVNKVEMEFSNPQALTFFLDPSGRRASLIRENNSNKLTITILDSIPQQVDEDLLALVKQVSAGYKLDLSFSADGNSALNIEDVNGRLIEVPAETEIVSSGKKVSLAMGIDSLFNLKQGLLVNFNW